MSRSSAMLRKAGAHVRTAAAMLRSRLRSVVGLQNPKIFCVGRNKTGTTSLEAALARLGYRIGDQRAAELLAEDWGKRDFRKLILYCHKADAFQDVPFSLYYTYQAMDAAFPGSKFILTVRDSADQWYRSVVRFHSQRLEHTTGERRRPTLEDIKRDAYVRPGWIWRMREMSGIVSDDPYPEMELKHRYDRHNEAILDYFRNRPGDLLVLNVADPQAMQKLCAFLKRPYDGRPFPKLNQSK
jgi:hypothetical protein